MADSELCALSTSHPCPLENYVGSTWRYISSHHPPLPSSITLITVAIAEEVDKRRKRYVQGEEGADHLLFPQP